MELLSSHIKHNGQDIHIRLKKTGRVFILHAHSFYTTTGFSTFKGEREKHEQSSYGLSGCSDDAGAVLTLLAFDVDQFRYVHFEKNFLCLHETFPTR